MKSELANICHFTFYCLPIGKQVYILPSLMLKIRFSPTGRKRANKRRIVVTEHTNPASSGEIEIVGWYDPISKQSWYQNGSY
jgi:hypothetical protein